MEPDIITNTEPSGRNDNPHVPTISVAIPAYNYGNFLGTAIQSVLSQDLTDIELIIINNASTDNTDEVVSQFLDDTRVRYIINETNIGGLPNLQKCYLCTQAPYILFLSADDFILPGALSKLFTAITSDATIDFVYARYMFVDRNDNITNDNINHPGWLPYAHKGRLCELADLMQFDCYISMPTVLFRRSVFERFGNFSASIRVSDYEFFMRLAAGGCVSYFINENLAAFRHHGNQMSVGGDVVSSGSQVNDQLTLLEMYVTENNYAKLAGCQPGIIRMLTSKIEAFNRCPERNLEGVAGMLQRIRAVMDRVSSLQVAVPDNFPMVSIIVPTFNRPEMLRCALQSILVQTYTNFEIIVVNDGGEDIQELLGPLNTRNNIVYLQHETTRERSAARNSGLKAARGKYIAYLDDDDRYYPDHLRVLVNFLESSRVKVAYSDAYRAVETFENNTYVVKQRQLLYSSAFDPNRLLVENLFPNLCIMHAKECTSTVGMFDETYQTHEDWEMWLRMSREYTFHHIPVITAEYSYRNDKTNTSTARLAEFNETRVRIYQQYRHFAQLNPPVIEAQQKVLRQLGVMFTEKISLFDFMNTITDHVEKNHHVQAVSYYDAHRKSFHTSAELVKFDSLIQVLKSREPLPGTR